MPNSYECNDCFFRVGNLTDIKTHMIKEQAQQNFKMIHGKLDRKDPNYIKTTEDIRFDLFTYICNTVLYTKLIKTKVIFKALIYNNNF